MTGVPSEDEATARIANFFATSITPHLEGIHPEIRSVLDVGSGNGYRAVEVAQAIKAASLTMTDRENFCQVTLNEHRRYEIVNAESASFLERFRNTHYVITAIQAVHEMHPIRFVNNVLLSLPYAGCLVVIDNSELAWQTFASQVSAMPLEQRRHFDSDMRQLMRTGMHRDETIEDFWTVQVDRHFPGHVHFEWLPGAYLVVYTAANWGDFKPQPK